MTQGKQGENLLFTLLSVLMVISLMHYSSATGELAWLAFVYLIPVAIWFSWIYLLLMRFLAALEKDPSADPPTIHYHQDSVAEEEMRRKIREALNAKEAKDG